MRLSEHEIMAMAKECAALPGLGWIHQDALADIIRATFDAMNQRLLEQRKDYVEYCCSYEFRGQQWAVSILARSLEEARQRCSVLGRLKLDGECVDTIFVGNEPLP